MMDRANQFAATTARSRPAPTVAPSRHLFTLSILFLAGPASADRDIVFSAQFYKWSGKYYVDRDWSSGFISGRHQAKPEQTLKDAGPYHLYRINPNGKGRKQITHGPYADLIPRWSPDGRRIAFIRVADSKGVQLCLISEKGGSPRTLCDDRLADEFWVHDIIWSPNGSWIALVYSNGNSRLVSLNGRRNGNVNLQRASYCAWSPDSRRAFLSLDDPVHDRYSARIFNLANRNSMPVSVPLRFPFWLDNQSIIGQDPTIHDGGYAQRLLVMDSQGRTIRKLQLRSARRRDDDDYEPFLEEARWVRIHGDTHRLMLESMCGKSDGSHYTCYRVDIRTGRFRGICDGRLIGISPDGRQILSADDGNWIGPYKHGGRRCGPLELIDLSSGRKRRLTGRLVSIDGGDWRHPADNRKRIRSATSYRQLVVNCKRADELRIEGR